jgi:carbon storage regulator
MLVLSRKPGESIVIDGQIVVKIVRLEGDMVKLGIEAPADVPVHRQEVYDEIQKNNQEAVTSGPLKLPRLAPEKKKPILAAASAPETQPKP